MAQRAVTLVSCCLLATSCSWAFVVPPAPTPGDRNDPGDCTESRAAPIADAAFAGLMAGTLLLGGTHCYAVRDGMTADGTQASCSAAAFLGLSTAAIAGAVSAVSAVQGFHTTERCRYRRAVVVR